VKKCYPQRVCKSGVIHHLHTAKIQNYLVLYGQVQRFGNVNFDEPLVSMLILDSILTEKAMLLVFRIVDIPKSPTLTRSNDLLRKIFDVFISLCRIRCE
jgi:hypothetical protein